MFRIIIQISYGIYISIIPYCYTRIYIFRKNLVMPGNGKKHEEQVKMRRRRNHVTFTSNMAVWLIEAFTTVGVSKHYHQIYLASSVPLDKCPGKIFPPQHHSCCHQSCLRSYHMWINQPNLYK